MNSNKINTDQFNLLIAELESKKYISTIDTRKYISKNIDTKQYNLILANQLGYYIKSVNNHTIKIFPNFRILKQKGIFTLGILLILIDIPLILFYLNKISDIINLFVILPVLMLFISYDAILIFQLKLSKLDCSYSKLLRTIHKDLLNYLFFILLDICIAFLICMSFNYFFYLILHILIIILLTTITIYKYFQILQCLKK